MTTYRLPDGAEVRAADSNLAKAPTLANHTWVIHPTLGAISCYTGILAPVHPQQPPEPPDGTLFSNGADAVLRVDDPDNDTEGAWFFTGHKQLWRWDEVAREVTKPGWRRYIPDPADDAPSLPWTLGDHKDRIGVTDNHLVWVNLKPDYHSPDEAELRAKAMLRAAREAREVEQP